MKMRVATGEAKQGCMSRITIRPETLPVDAVRQLLFEPVFRVHGPAAIAMLLHSVVQGHHTAAGEFCCALRFSQLLLAAEVRL